MTKEIQAGALLTDLSCSAFAKELAAKKSVPGGGGAAALAGALGVALCSMAGQFTVGKKAYADVEDDVLRMLDEAEDIRENLLELVEEDATSFAPLARAYRIPRDDPSRKDAIAEATRGACRVPFRIMEEAARAIRVLEEMERKGSAFMVSDVGCGASLCASALEAARLTVLVNTVELKGDPLADELDRKADRMLEDCLPRAQAIVRSVSDRLRGRE